MPIECRSTDWSFWPVKLLVRSLGNWGLVGEGAVGRLRRRAAAKIIGDGNTVSLYVGQLVNIIKGKRRCPGLGKGGRCEFSPVLFS